MANIKDLPVWWAGEAAIDPRSVEAQTIDDIGGAIKLCARFNVPDAATASYDFVNTTGRTIRVVSVTVVKVTGNGGASNTIQVLSTASAITEAIDTNVVSTTVVEARVLNSLNHSIVNGGILRITSTKSSGNAAAIVYVDYVFL